MTNFLKNFRRKEDGAVTVDWVVLTAAIVALGFAVFSSVKTGATDMASGIGSALTTESANVTVK